MKAFLRRALKDEKIRYLVSGAWNSLFGWAAFAGTWALFGDALNLWAISAIGHLLATSQAFVVQRQLVFQQTGEPVARQFAKFQAAYLILLGIGALVVNALHVQGMHPLLAQVFGMALLAVCGFVLGKSFTFNPERLEVQALASRVGTALRAHRLALACFGVSIVLFEWFWGERFYADPAHIGHDFGLTATSLLEGRFWVDANGVMGALFNPPWFTPAWCAGAAFYADPQSAFYSPLQLFALWVDPFQATHLNTWLFAAVAYWGSYALARRVLGWGAEASVVFATLGIVNTFLPLRSAVGEAGYQPFYLWTLIVLALGWPAAVRHRDAVIWPAIGVTLALTAWLQFGFAGMMVPAFLGCMVFSAVLVVLGRITPRLVLARAALGGLLAMILNGSKLYESASLMKNFPRDFYSMPGFPSLLDAVTSVGFALTQPSEWAAFFGLRRLHHVQFPPMPHEWALSFGLGALAAALLSVFALGALRRRQIAPPPLPGLSLPQRLTAVAALVVMAVPVLLLWDQGVLRTIIKQIPILNSATWPMRWIAIYVPATQLLLAWPIQRVFAHVSGQRSTTLLVLAFALTWLGPATEPVGYFLDPNIQSYDSRPVTEAHVRTRTSGAVAIERISVAEEGRLRWSLNDDMIHGASQGYCYNPLYGYLLESFPQIERIQPGPALMADNSGQSLIFNPACLVHPGENNCAPGAGFRMDDGHEQAQARNFVARRPIEWRRPLRGRVLAWTSQICFWILLTLVALRLWQDVLRLMRPFRAAAEPPSARPGPPMPIGSA